MWLEYERCPWWVRLRRPDNQYRISDEQSILIFCAAIKFFGVVCPVPRFAAHSHKTRSHAAGLLRPMTHNNWQVAFLQQLDMFCVRHHGQMLVCDFSGARLILEAG